MLFTILTWADEYQESALPGPSVPCEPPGPAGPGVDDPTSSCAPGGPAETGSRCGPMWAILGMVGLWWWALSAAY